MIKYFILYFLMTKRAFYLFLGLIALSGCDYYDGRLEIHNKSTDIVAIETFLDSIPALLEVGKTEYYLSHPIYPGESENPLEMGTNGWLFRIKNSKNNRLNLFVFQIDSLKLYGIDSLISRGIYKKYIFSEEELNDSDWKVIIE